MYKISGGKLPDDIKMLWPCSRRSLVKRTLKQWNVEGHTQQLKPFIVILDCGRGGRHCFVQMLLQYHVVKEFGVKFLYKEKVINSTHY